MLNQTSPRSAADLPDLCGSEQEIARATAATAPVYLNESTIDFPRTRSTFAIALHMHQPLIPAGGDDLRTAAVIGNLQFMLDHPEIKDAHNATTFIECYKRMGKFIPELLAEGKHPRVMLDYSGCLLHAVAQMGRQDVLDALKLLATDPACRQCV